MNPASTSTLPGARTLVLASGNAGKLRELSALLSPLGFNLGGIL